MKKNIILAVAGAAALLTLGACNKNGMDIPSNGGAPVAGSGEAYVTLSLGSTLTKAAGETLSNEKTIRNVQIYVFRNPESGGDKGLLDVSMSEGFGSELAETGGQHTCPVIKCSTGPRRFYVVVNDSQDRTPTVSTETDFLAQEFELRNARADRLVMVGTMDQNLTEGSHSYDINVHRLVASVVLNSVKNDFISPAYQQDGVFRIEDVYLINVPGRRNFGETLAPASIAADDWYGKLGNETRAEYSSNLIYDPKTGDGTIVNYSTTNSARHAFYAFPNNCTASEDLSWSARATLLVLEASIRNGSVWTKYYYPVTIAGGLEANKQYTIDLTVKRPGSNDPNIPVKFDDVTPTIKVEDWGSGDTYSPVI